MAGQGTADDAAVREWAPVARSIARGFFFPGADRDDVDQEALIGLWKGLRDFNGSGVKAAFLSMAIRRHLIEKTRQARREKHRPLTESVREAVDEDGYTVAALEVLPARRRQGGFAPNLLAMTAFLPPLERRAVVGVAIGMTYAELGDSKAVDNALQRARKKLRERDELREELRKAHASLVSIRKCLGQALEQRTYRGDFCDCEGLIEDAHSEAISQAGDA